MKAEITKIVLKLKGREIELSAEEAKATLLELQKLLEPMVKEVPVYYPVPSYPPVVIQPQVNPPWQPPIVWCGGLGGQATSDLPGGQITWGTINQTL